MGRRLWIIALSASVIAAPAAAQNRCNLMKAAEIPVTIVGTRGVVTAQVNGKPARLVVDTGAFFSILDDGAMDRFDLKRAEIPPGMMIRGIGGGVKFGAGRAASFDVGDLKLRNYDFVVGGGGASGSSDGLLGENILAGGDSEFDMANGMVRLFHAENCSKNNLAYWAADKAVSVTTLIRSDSNTAQPMGTAKVNGKDIRVVFDTGASYSMIKRETAAKLGFSPTGPGVTADGITVGGGAKRVETWLAPFESFAVGGEEVKNTKLRVAEIELRDADMLLGADFFLSHRIYVARSQNKIYITYNGGPVFQLDAPRTGRPGAPTVAAAPLGGELKTADEYTRRGKASIARREYASAIADFGKAIDMEPNDASHYYDRGAAHLAARQPVLAFADLDKSLSIKPDQLDARMMRGELWLQRNQIASAKADFAAAAKIATPQDQAHLRIADDYVRAALTQDAVAEYNNWFVAHPYERNNPEVLNARCRARALSGAELELALADCNASIKASDNSAFLESRGMAYLRMGQFDKAIADYDASLKKQPGAAWPLYGRGLAKIRKGLDEEGKADIRQALTIAPVIAVVASRYGLGPPPGTLPQAGGAR